jgi:hypothetical protein
MRLLSVLATSLMLTTLGCDGGTRLKGIVWDTQHRPIAGAKVTMLIGEENSANRHVPYSQVTDDTGRFDLMRTHAPGRVRVVLEVQHDEFQPYRKVFTDSSTIELIVLARRESKNESPQEQTSHSPMP